MLKKRILSVIICITMVFAMIVQSGVTYAADTTNNYYSNAKTMWEKGEYPTSEDKVFAGWYKNEGLTGAVRDASGFDANGGAYAKFVDEKVLSVQCQIKKTQADGVTETTGSVAKDDTYTMLRLVTTVNNLAYEAVGFDVEVNGKVQKLSTDTVYQTIYGYVNESGVAYKPNSTDGAGNYYFSSESNYFMSYTFNKLPNSFFGVPIVVTPKWTTLDGTVVEGMARTVVIYNGLGSSQFEGISSYGTLWSAPSTMKVAQDNTSFSNKGAAELSYQAVRNEYESSQLVLTASAAVGSFELYASDLKNADGERILAENVDVYVQKYIPFDDTNSNYDYSKGSMPDALIPMKAANAYGENAIASGKNGGLWVTINVPKDADAGNYAGEFVLRVKGDSGEKLLKVPVSMEVMDYTLTDDNHAQTIFSWRYDRVAPGELDGSLAMMEKYYDFFKDYRISLQSLPLGTLSGAEMVDKLLETTDEGRVYYDDITTYTLLSEVGEISNNFTGRLDSVKEQILTLAAASTTSRNLLDKAVFYFIDEPDVSNADARNSVIEQIGLLDTMLQECVDTINSDSTGTYTNFKNITNWQTVLKEIPNIIPVTQTGWLLSNQSGDGKTLLEAMNCICPLFRDFSEAQTSKLMDMCETYGLELWWYGNSTPGNPAPSYHIADTNLLSARSLSWLQNKYNVEGNLYWDAAAYTDENEANLDEYINVYENPYRKTGESWPAGDGFLTYPGEPYGVYGPIPSMRLMSIRDGMEEYELLKAVEAKYEEKKSSFGISDVDANMESMFFNALYFGDMETVIADQDNGLDFASLRDKLLSMLVNLEKDNGLGYAMSGISIDDKWIGTDTGTFTCYVQSGATLAINGSTVTSGTSKKINLDGATTVTITVTNGGVTETYNQYIGTSTSWLSTASETSFEPVEATTTTEDTTKAIQTYNATENSESLLSFDSYENITGAGLRVSKLLGETQVNTDATYITEGNGSWMIRPEGDYGDKDGYAWFRMRADKLGTNDFNGYQSVLMDVYNASDEEAYIQWTFDVLDSTSAYSKTEARVYKLAPNAWTTCAYDLSDEVYSYRFDLTNVKYMTVTFLDKKESKDDTTYPELYLDNLRGLLMDGSRPAGEAEYSFETGITFDELDEFYIFNTGDQEVTSMELSRVEYKNSTMEQDVAQLGLGQYGLKGDATGTTWPEVSVALDKSYAKGSILTFWMYVEVDEEVANGQTYHMESSNWRGGTANKVLNGNCQFNQWVQVSIELGSLSDQLWFFVNFDNGSGSSKLGDENVTIYMDEFKITDNSWGPVQ